MIERNAASRSASNDGVGALLARVAGGDPQAFETMYRDTCDTLLGICLRILPDRAEAEDVLQDVYVSIWKKAAQFDPARSHALTWLGSIARNRAIDRRRSLPAPATHAAVDVAQDLRDPSPSPATRAEAAIVHTRLDDCLERLEPRPRRLIRTAFFEGATYEELAVRSNAPLGSIKSWIRRGLLQLKACLDQ